jgi:hypothetical protein
MGEGRSPANVSETFYDRLRAAALPDPLRLSIKNSLTMLLEDDGDGVAPDVRSFAALLKFISDRPRWVAPGLTINRQGAFVAVWEIPGVFRWSLVFSPSGISSGRRSKKPQPQRWLDTPAKAAPTQLSYPGSCGRASWPIS